MLQYKIPQFPEYTIYIEKFSHVKNVAELRSQLAHLPFAYIDARTILSLEQLTSAVYKAILETEYNRMRTRNIHSECILSLSPSSNIGDALKRFGIKESSDELVVVKIVKNMDTIKSLDGLCQVEADSVPVSDEQFKLTSDISVIKKVCYLSTIFWA